MLWNTDTLQVCDTQWNIPVTEQRNIYRQSHSHIYLLIYIALENDNFAHSLFLFINEIVFHYNFVI